MRLLVALCALLLPAAAQVQNLRITEVFPARDLVEVTNFGPAFTTSSAHPFCHRFNYSSSIPAGTSFLAGEIRLFTVSGLNDFDSDLWLYSRTPFGTAANIVHGLKYGPAANVGRTALAATVGLWPSGTAFVATSTASYSYDGFGFAPNDWYVDETPTPGVFDVIAVGGAPSNLGVPSGVETFETLTLGDDVTTLVGWPVVDTSATAGQFSVRVVGDVNGLQAPLPSANSTKWLRVHDTDAGDVQNRFYSDFLDTGSIPESYRMEMLVNPLLLPAPTAANRPRLTVQHLGANGVFNLWGIGLSSAGAELVVFANGGVAATTSLGSLGLGSWVQVSIDIDLLAGTATGRVGNVTAVLPIQPASTIDLTQLRFCFRGEGLDNVSTILLDDLSFDFQLPFQGNIACVNDPAGAGLEFSVANGGAGNAYQHLVAVSFPNRAPNGALFGIEPTFAELLSQVFVPPFFGTLDSNGSALTRFALPGLICPLGLTVDRVTVELDPILTAILRTDTATTITL